MNIALYADPAYLDSARQTCANAGYNVAALVNGAHAPTNLGSELATIRPEQIGDGEYDFVLVASEEPAKAEKQLCAAGVTLEMLRFFPGRADKQRGVVYLAPAAVPNAALHWDILQIPLTNACNLRCAHCGRTKSSHPELWAIDEETFSLRLSRFRPDQFSLLHIGGDGEQTISPAFGASLYAAAEQGWTNVGAITNGAVPDPHAFANYISDGVLHQLTVSTEGATPETFAAVRGYPYKKFTDFLEILARARKAGHPEFKVIFLTTCMRRNQHELTAILELAARYGVDEVRYMHLRPFYSEGERPEKLCVPSQGLDRLPDEEKSTLFQSLMDKAESLGLTITLPEPLPVAEPEPANSAGLVRCTQPFSFVHVGRHGEVYPCCQILEQRSMGDIVSQDFLSLWRGPAYAELINGLRPGGKPVPECAVCPKYKGYNW